jgi:uncharacterized protein involved in exopolysaccharide biosynthesis/Mrp family chromosome partitioning ATPase
MTSLVSSARRQGAPAADAPEGRRRRSDGVVEIAEIWLILWHRRLMILAAAGLFAAAAAAYGLLSPALFTATTQILVDPRDRNVVSNDVNPSIVSPDGGIAQVESQASLMQSTGVLTRAIRAARLTEDPEFASRGLVASLLGLAERDAPSVAGTLTAAEARALQNLRRRIAVKRADKVLVLDVIVTTKDRDKSAVIANAIAEAYLADQAEARSRSAREASAALTARLAEQRRRVEEAENAVERYRVENNLVTSSGRLVTDQQVGEISNQHAAAQARVAALRAQVEQLQRRRDGALAGSSIEAAQSTVITRLREQEAVLVQREADLQTQLGPLHPQIVAARNQLANTRRLIATEIQRIEQTVRAEYDRALGNERLLAGRLEALARQNQGSDQASVRLRDLQRDLEAARSVYATFLLRAQETREQATLDTTNARIISRAQPPQQKSWPPILSLIVGAGAIGLGLGAGLALIREYAAPHLLSVAQAEVLVDAPVVGILPKARQSPKAADAAAGPEAPEAGAAGLAMLNLFDRSEDRRRVADSIVLVAPERDGAERLRAVRLLAEAAAERGDSVLFVDAAAESSRPDGEAGLIDVLRGDQPFEAAVDYGREGEIAVMRRGAWTGPQRTGGRGAAARFLADAGRDFDLVVIDGGSLDRNVAIAPLLGAVDHVVLVAELYRTRQSDAAALAETAAVMGGAITATILVEPGGRA